MTKHEEEIRNRLTSQLRRVNRRKIPPNWLHVSTVAVGGLTCVGFSKESNLLLIVSSAGRGVVDCSNGEKVAREYAEFDGQDDSGLYCEGIGPIAGENVLMAGIHGGGLPLQNKNSESIEAVAPNWPVSEVILCQDMKMAVVDGDENTCFLLSSGDIRAYGFSWNGQYVVVATSSEIDIWKRATL